jgi:hypothetical protein
MRSTFHAEPRCQRDDIGRVQTDQGCVRAGVLARGPGTDSVAQIAFARLKDRELSLAIECESPTAIRALDHDDVFVGTTLRTGLAADARIRIDGNDTRLRIPADRTCRTTDHTNRILAMHARVREHERA